MTPLYQTPLRLLIIAALSIFISEAIVMGIISLILPFSSRLTEALFDSSLLIVMLSPMLYFFLFKPLLANIRERKLAEEEVKKLNAELEKRINELEEVNGELESFSYSASHDLRSPLLAIEGFTQRLADAYGDVLDIKGNDYVRRILLSSKRMSQIIDSLLDLARVARVEINPENVNLSNMARTVCHDLSQRYPDNHVKVRIENGVTASGDARLLRIVLENLIGNAWKYTSKQSDPVVEFGVLHGNNDSPAYYVRDNGVGFNMDYSDKLFSAFERLHSIEEYPGTGVGLATVKRIINRHKGKIWAESEVGKGAVFYFTLPSN